MRCPASKARLAGPKGPKPCCGGRRFRVRWGTRETHREDGKMKNYMDGGEAILEAFRKLKIDYILS
jgi:hypothetical protein